MVAVYGAGNLDYILRSRADRLAVMRRQLSKVIAILYGVQLDKDEQTKSSRSLESEGLQLIKKVKRRLGRA